MRYFLLICIFLSTTVFAQDDSIMPGLLKNVKLGMTINEVKALQEITNLKVPSQDYMFPHAFDAFTFMKWGGMDINISMLFDLHNNAIKRDSQEGLKCIDLRPMYYDKNDYGVDFDMNSTENILSETKSFFLTNVMPEFIDKCINKWGEPTEKLLSVWHDLVKKDEQYRIGYLLWKKGDSEIILQIINPDEIREKPVNYMSVLSLLKIYIYDPSYKSFLYPEAFLINEDKIITDPKEVEKYFEGLLKS